MSASSSPIESAAPTPHASIDEAERDPTRWSQLAERGSLWGMRATAWAYRTLGRRFAEVLIHCVVTYFFATDPRGRRASRAFLRRVHRTPQGRKALGREPGWWQSFLHYREFALSIGDRLAIWFGRADDFAFEMENEAYFDRLQEEGRGAILIGAHLGSFDALRALAVRRRIPVNVLMFTAHAQRINTLFREISPEVDARVIPVQQGSVDSVFEIRACLRRGELVAILGDRMEPGDQNRASTVQLLGDEVELPQAPFLLAALLGCPVFTIFALREGPGRYSVFAERLAERIHLPRRERERGADSFVAAYAGLLERYATRYPYQWFNFFDYWGDEAK